MNPIEQSLFQEYLSFIKLEIPNWALLDYDSVNFQLLTGTSNKVYKVWNSKEVQPNSLLLRIFGPNEVTDKLREHQIFLYLGKCCRASIAYLSFNKSITLLLKLSEPRHMPE